jgi:group I intron endonuclease
MAVVYRIRNVLNGKCYVGSSGADAGVRWLQHVRRLNRGKHHSPGLLNAWRKYGPEAFVFEVLEEVLIQQCVVAREQWWFDKLKPFGRRGYNVCRDAGSTAGQRLSPETRKKMSLASEGRPKSEAHRQALAAARRRNLARPSLRGKPLTEEHRQKIAESVRLAKSGKRVEPKEAVNVE